MEAVNCQRVGIEVEGNSTAMHEVTEVNNAFGKGLVMASLNVNSLLTHIDELEIFTSANELMCS